jgi:hypothetical protein
MNKEFKRMQKLAGLDEIKVNRPTSNLDILNKMMEQHPDGSVFFDTIYFQDSLEDWMEYEGLDENDPVDTDTIQLGKIFFMWLNKKDIYSFVVRSDDYEDIVFPKPYKKAITYGLGDDSVLILMHNF